MPSILQDALHKIVATIAGDHDPKPDGRGAAAASSSPTSPTTRDGGGNYTTTSGGGDGRDTAETETAPHHPHDDDDDDDSLPSTTPAAPRSAHLERDAARALESTEGWKPSAASARKQSYHPEDRKHELQMRLAGLSAGAGPGFTERSA